MVRAGRNFRRQRALSSRSQDPRGGWKYGLPLDKEETQMRYVVLWALGVPISGLIVLHLLGMI
jgi:hypothetical protein